MKGKRLEVSCNRKWKSVEVYGSVLRLLTGLSNQVRNLSFFENSERYDAEDDLAMERRIWNYSELVRQYSAVKERDKYSTTTSSKHKYVTRPSKQSSKREYFLLPNKSLIACQHCTRVATVRYIGEDDGQATGSYSPHGPKVSTWTNVEVHARDRRCGPQFADVGGNVACP
jgi:hypothetical protein